MHSLLVDLLSMSPSLTPEQILAAGLYQVSDIPV